MRGKLLLALTILSLTSLSGCLGFGEETSGDDVDECEGLEGEALHQCEEGDHEHPDGGNHTGNESLEPNLAPVANLTMTDAAGNVLTNGSAIFVGDTVTFSANGSADPDGQLELVALTVIDKNGTRTISLMNGGPAWATLRFDTQGYLIATLRVLDNDGDAASAADYAWINQKQVKEGSLTLPAPSVGVGDCAGPGASNADSSVLDSSYSAAESFTVPNGTRWISATATGNVAVNICDMSGSKISEGSAAKDVSTADKGAEGGFAPGVTYTVFVKATAAQASYTIEVVTHFEPKPAA